MSAPNQGRQSPEPESQSGAQVGAPSSGEAKHNTGAGEKAADKNKDQLSNLESNPKGAMEDNAASKTAK